MFYRAARENESKIMKINFCAQQHSTNQNTNLKKEKNKGIIAGYLVNRVISNQVPVVSSLLFLPVMKKISNSITPKEADIISNALEIAIEKSNIKQKGLNVFHVSEENINEVTQKCTEMFMNSKMTKFFTKFYGEDSAFERCIRGSFKLRVEYYAKEVQNGKNAFFWANGINTIMLPQKGKGIQLASFHELGHALNYNFESATKILQSSRQFAYIFGTLAVLLSALTLKDKANAVDENGNKKKGVRQFIKNHAGLIAAASMLPTTIEEGVATLKGDKLAKDALKNSPSLLKKMRLSNAVGFLSYIIAMLITGLAAHCTVKVKDKIQENYENKCKSIN